MIVIRPSVVFAAAATILLSTPAATADLLGIDPGFPLLVFENPGGTSYDAATNEYAIVADAVSIQFTPKTPPRPVVPTDPDGQRFVRLRILVDNDGTLIGGAMGPDLQIVGAVDADGDGTIDYTGTLLSGEVLDFGFFDSGAGDPKRGESVVGDTDEFDFRLRLTGGAIAGLYGADDIGVVNESAMSTFEDFTVDFFGDASGVVGPTSPRGACCRPDGVCVDDVGQEDCEAAGGFFGGRDSLCATTECPGACCLPDTTCLFVPRTECLSRDGDFRGEGARCENVTCATAGGACCFDDGSCTERTQDECRDEGGRYQGAGTTCIPGLCPEAEGACCFPNGACFVLTEQSCSDQGGLYQGDDVECTPDRCPRPKGACCFDDGRCNVVREDLCGILGGAYQGDETICFPGLCESTEGACCFDDGRCLVLTQRVCNESGGDFQGRGTECVPGLCPGEDGACCLPDEDCPTGEFECDRKIVQMTMIWDGNEHVRIRAYDGDTDDELLADIDGIEVGDAVAIGPMDGPNNVIWEIFRAGTDDLLGLSEFHRSCSDREMNGPEDCGERQGNGKSDDEDLINDWLLEGLVDGDGDAFDCGLGGGGAACVILDADACAAAGGTFQGAGTSCNDVDCRAPTGACCLDDDDSDDDDDCMDLSLFCCAAVGGVFLGEDTSCATEPCAGFECEGKIVELTMIWDGAESVRIRAYDGDTDDPLLADIDDIQVGDTVTVGPLDGPNDSYWEVFRAGTDDLLGLSKFHRSCSDRDMNGPEDCGKRQGNGKRNDDDLINDWILEGLVDDEGGVLDCGGG